MASIYVAMLTESYLIARYSYHNHYQYIILLPDPMRRIEIWVDKAHWSLTDSDGQLQLADIRFTNFSYNRLTFSDNSGEHRVELKTFRLENLMPNTPPIYKVMIGITYLPMGFSLEVAGITIAMPLISTTLIWTP